MKYSIYLMVSKSVLYSIRFGHFVSTIGPQLLQSIQCNTLNQLFETLEFIWEKKQKIFLSKYISIGNFMKNNVFTPYDILAVEYRYIEHKTNKCKLKLLTNGKARFE